MSDTLYKTCSKCGNSYPIEFFNVDKKKSGGFSVWCKSCKSEHSKRRQERNKLNVSSKSIKFKRCGYCNEILPISNFKHSFMSNCLYHTYCRKCSIRHTTDRIIKYINKFGNKCKICGYTSRDPHGFILTDNNYVSYNKKIRVSNDNKYVPSKLLCINCYILHKNGCMKNINNIKNKLDCVHYKGGKCVSCGLNFTHNNLNIAVFHHVDSSNKLFVISNSSMVLSNKSVKDELDKCVLLCSLCHVKIHSNAVDLYETV